MRVPNRRSLWSNYWPQEESGFSGDDGSIPDARFWPLCFLYPNSTGLFNFPNVRLVTRAFAIMEMRVR